MPGWEYPDQRVIYYQFIENIVKQQKDISDRLSFR